MKKILIGYLIDGKIGGIDKYLLNILDVLLQEENVKVDFLTKKVDLELKEYLQKKGVGLYETASLKHPYLQYKQTRKIMRENQYDMAYFNISEAFNCIGILAAHKEKINRIMVHSHSSNCAEPQKMKRLIKIMCHNICKKWIVCKKATDYFACSKTAANWMYTPEIISSSKFSLIYNAVNKEIYHFNAEIREKVRNEIGITERIVIGHVGGFTKPKNTAFLIDIIDELQKIEERVCLLLVGDGPEMDLVKHRVKELHMEKNVIFLGIRHDIEKLLQAMDIFVLPSYFEGLPFVAIEAQMAGLKVILSDTISDEVVLTKKCVFEDIKESAKTWADVIYKNLDYSREETEFLDSSKSFEMEEYNKKIRELFKEEE